MFNVNIFPIVKISVGKRSNRSDCSPIISVRAGSDRTKNRRPGSQNGEYKAD